jgi:hypothetical protein
MVDANRIGATEPTLEPKSAENRQKKKVQLINEQARVLGRSLSMLLWQ